MRNAALAGILAISLIAVLAIFGVQRKDPFPEPLAQRDAVRLAIVGDIMLGREVGTLMDTNGYDYPLKNISAFLKNFDISIGNFEGTVRDIYNYRDGLKLKFSFSPKSLTQLVDANFSIMSLANNHAFDYDTAGFEETRQKLQSVGISPLGHPYDVSKGIVTTVELKNRLVSFLGFNATVPAFDTLKAADLVSKTKSENPSSTLIVLIHWGDEYVATHNATQEKIAHALATSGANLIIGTHPHVVQDVELYQDTLIFYSLGNFVFDQNFSAETKKGLMLGVELHATSTDVGLFPVNIVRSQPTLMNKAERTLFLETVSKKSPAALRDQILKGLLTF